jgi:hypothetical protein
LSRGRRVLRAAAVLWLQAVLGFAVAALLAGVVESAVAAQVLHDPRAPLAYVPAALGLAWAVTAGLVFALGALLGRPLVALAASALAMVGLAYGNLQVQAALGRSVGPRELGLLRQAAALAPAVGLRTVAVACGLAAAAGILAWLVLRSPRRPWYESLTALGWSAGCLGAVWWLCATPGGLGWLDHHNVRDVPWAPRQSESRHGLLASLALRTPLRTLSEPEGYSRASILSRMRRSAPPPRGEEARPDVIVVLAEALWDPTQLDVAFSRDPMPRLRALAGESSFGSVYSPVYGGGTANAEFELLTGLTTRFLQEGSYPFLEMDAPVESLPSVLRDAGWRTSAVHNFHGWYWNRRAAYALLGIDRFVALEELGDVPNVGPWPSDEVVVDAVLAELARGEEPHFVMTVTMGTHGPYNYPVVEPVSVEVTGDRPWAQRHPILNYANAVFRLDAALGRLIDALRARERPSELVIVGDHLPILGENRALYRALGVLPPDAPDDDPRMHRTPIWLWSSRGGPTAPVEVGMNAVAPLVLRHAGLPPSGFFAWLEDYARRQPVTPRAGSGIGANLVADYRLFVYDRLEGEGYSRTGFPDD